MALQKKVESIDEYKEVKDAVETLEGTITKTWFGGKWESKDGHPVFLSGDEDIESVGYKYFLIDLGHEGMVKCKPVEGGSMKDAGFINVKIK